MGRFPGIKRRKQDEIKQATGASPEESKTEKGGGTPPELTSVDIPSFRSNTEEAENNESKSGSVIQSQQRRDPSARARLARHSESPDALHSMIGDENPWVLKLLALNSATSEDDRAELAEHSNRSVREAVAQATQDPELLAALVDDPAPPVREAVASNPATPDRTRESLSRDGAHNVRAASASRMTCGERLSRLARDRDPRVRVVAATNDRLRLADERSLSNDDDPRVCEALASRSTLNEETLRALSEHTEPKIRERVAAHSLTPRSVLRALIEDPAPQVRYRVATAAREAELLSELAADPDVRVQEGIVGNANAPSEIKEIVVQGMDKDARARVARRAMDASVLAMLAEDESLLVRHEVAGNPRANQAVLAILAEEEDEVIAARAAYRLNGDDRLERHSLMGPASPEALEADDEEGWAFSAAASED